MFENVKHFFQYAKYRTSPPRPASDEDRAGWFAAAETQTKQKPAMGTREQIRGYLFSMNPVRMRRIQRDYRWMQRQMQKAGLNPEDARWLL